MGESPRSEPAPPRAGRSLAFALGALGALACASRPLPPDLDVAPLAAPAPLALGPNDVLRVRVHGYPELSTPEGPGAPGTRVDADGALDLPLVGAVLVGGLSVAEARARVAAACAVYVPDPHVELSVVAFGARRFYVLGEVKEPGPYVMDRPLTVYQALSYAGGFERFAVRDEVALLRREGERVVVRRVDASRPDAQGFAALQPEDILFVRRTGSGGFSENVLPYLTAVSQALGTTASAILIEDRLD